MQLKVLKLNRPKRAVVLNNSEKKAVRGGSFYGFTHHCDTKTLPGVSIFLCYDNNYTCNTPFGIGVCGFYGGECGCVTSGGIY